MNATYGKLVVAALAAGMCMAAAANPADLDSAMPKARGTATKSTSESPDFGNASVHYSPIDSSSMVPFSNNVHFTHSTSGGFFCNTSGTDNRAVGQIHMPHGVELRWFRAWLNDNSGAGDISAALYETCQPDLAASVPSPELLATVSTTGTPGAYSSSQLLDNRRADNTSCTYRVLVRFGDSDNTACPGTQWFYKARIEWARVTPPAPGTATFGDVPTGDPFFAVIEALADSGVTAGCGGGNYCPNAPITRAGIAAMLVRALALQPTFFPDSANP